MSYPQLKLLIDGEWIAETGAGTLSVTNPVINVKGTLSLLITDPARVETAQMIYAARGTTFEGVQVDFRGVK